MKKNILNKLISLAMAMIYTLGVCVFPPALLPLSQTVYADEAYEKDSISLDAEITKINKEGDLILSVTGKELKNAGFSVGDEVKIKIKAYDYSEKMPFFNNDSDSESDECALITDGNNASLSVAKGSFAEDEELFSPSTGQNGEVTWKDKDGGSGTGKKVKIILHEKGTYLKQYKMRNPERSNDRDDFSSGSKYANFREITAGTIGADVLFRSSSPINDSIGRDEYAAKRMEKNGIKTVINLSDSRKEAEKYIKKSKNSYYGRLLSRGSVLCLDLDYDFDSKNFKKGMAEAVKFMSLHEGPYLIHCTEGKDRTGLLSALLESLMGASVKEMSEDYLETYTNFYDYDTHSDEYEYAKKNYLKEVYRAIAGVKKNSELTDPDYHAAAIKYLKDGGASDLVINALVQKLKGDGSNDKKTVSLTYDVKNMGAEGIFNLDRTGAAFSVYSGSAVKPGRSSLCINGTYFYNKRDYDLSFSDNVHAGKMTMTAKFKKKSYMYKSGLKKLVINYTIAPKKATGSIIRVKLNKKKTAIRSLRDLERDERIRQKYYSVDMDKKEITFNGDYTGKISFTV